MTTMPMILVTKKLDMGPYGTRPSLERQDNKPDNQPLAEHCTDRPD